MKLMEFCRKPYFPRAAGQELSSWVGYVMPTEWLISEERAIPDESPPRR